MINYYLLTKPGIIMGNLFTVAAGFLLASRGAIYFGLFLATMLGLAFIMASGCVLNNYIDRPLDIKMQRTKNRALVTGLISGKNAIFFALVLLIIGSLILYYFTNFIALILSLIGFFVYVVLYSIWKSHTIYGTAIGSIAGAIPPVVGYCAVSNQFDLGALILFTMMILWQMPHFFAIAMFHYEDYLAAGIPALPISKGFLRAKIHMTLYVVAFMCVSTLLTYFNYTGYVYLIITFLVSLVWLVISIRGFYTFNHHKWGREMFHWSLVLIATICILIPLDTI